MLCDSKAGILLLSQCGLVTEFRELWFMILIMYIYGVCVHIVYISAVHVL